MVLVPVVPLLSFSLSNQYSLVLAIAFCDRNGYRVKKETVLLPGCRGISYPCIPMPPHGLINLTYDVES